MGASDIEYQFGMENYDNEVILYILFLLQQQNNLKEEKNTKMIDRQNDNLDLLKMVIQIIKDSYKRWRNTECEILKGEDIQSKNYHRGEGNYIRFAQQKWNVGSQ